LAGCVSLESLSLVMVTFIEDDAVENSMHTLPDKDRTHLKSLQLSLMNPDLHRVTNCFMAPGCPLDISGLLRLSVTMAWGHNDHGDITRLLNASAKSLEIFCFSPPLKCEP
jgi:hypothetical protein